MSLPLRSIESTEAATVFAALGDPTRLRILSRLGVEGPLSIASLSKSAPITRQAVTKHLHALAAAGVVHRAQSGRRQQLWALAPQRLDEAQRYLDQVSQQWDDALGRLKTFVEE